jgi:fatty-acyl-CoA synthase
VMAAMVLREGTAFDPARFESFLADQPDLGPKQWPSFVRIGAEIPRTATFKIVKRVLSAEGTECADPVYPVRRP